MNDLPVGDPGSGNAGDHAGGTGLRARSTDLVTRSAGERRQLDHVVKRTVGRRRGRSGIVGSERDGFAALSGRLDEVIRRPAHRTVEPPTIGRPGAPTAPNQVAEPTAVRADEPVAPLGRVWVPA